MKDKDGFFSALLLGGLLGAAITYLYTNEKGKELREVIGETAKEISKEVLDAIIQKLEEMNMEPEQKSENTDSTENL